MHRRRLTKASRALPKTAVTATYDLVALLRETPDRPRHHPLQFSAALLVGVAVAAVGLGWAFTPAGPETSQSDQIVLPMTLKSAAATRIAVTAGDRDHESSLAGRLGGKPVKHGRYSLTVAKGSADAQLSVAATRGNDRQLLALPGETDDEIHHVGEDVRGQRTTVQAVDLVYPTLLASTWPCWSRRPTNYPCR